MHMRTSTDFQDQFFQDDFSVDAFLQTYSGTYTLEGLRDALSSHLKSLETKMIDIVNSESDTILSLSSSLNGLDTKIENLRSSLEQLKEEIMGVLNLIEDNMTCVQNLMESKKLTCKEKSSYINLTQALTCCERIKKILDVDSNKRPIPSDVLLRAVDQYILQETHLLQCNNSQLSQIEITDLSIVKHLVFDNYRETFLGAVHRKDKDELMSCLQMGVFLNNQKETESLMRREIIAPKLSEIITERSLQKSENGLRGVYTEIIGVIHSQMDLLLQLIHSTHASCNFQSYNFFLNSIWEEIDEKLRVNLSSVYAPGNPAIFQKRFIETMQFIEQLEEQFGDRKRNETIYNHPIYENHMRRWNLPVYFQIRFNEIVTNYETILSDELNLFVTETCAHNFKLKATLAVFDSIKYCLSPDVFIANITHRFWKLILQILSRFNTWIDNHPLKIPTLPSGEKTDKYESKVKFLVCLHSDMKTLSSVLPSTDVLMIPESMQTLAADSLRDASDELSKKLSEIETVICTLVSATSISALKQVSHIPRLFRKTNKSVPTEPAPYVKTILSPPQSFYASYDQQISQEIMLKLMDSIYGKITHEYSIIVNDILIQVRKTEDSLRRLKKVRQSQTTENSSMSDDQKIRTQLRLDVLYYCNEVQKTTKNVDVQPLSTLVLESNK